MCFRHEGVKTLREGDFEYRLYWKGEDTASENVELMVKCKLLKSVVNARRISPRISSGDLELCGKVLTIISVYGFQIDRSEDENCFYDDLSAEVHSKNVNWIQGS